MEKKDKWIKNFRNRMEDYSEPVPADLWGQLEKELDTPKVIPMWRRWQAVAAIALLVVVSSLTVWFWQSPSAGYIEQQSAELNSLRQPDELIPAPTTPEQPMAQVVPATPSTRTQRVKVAPAAILGESQAVPEVVTNEITDEKQTEAYNREEKKAEEVVAAETQQQPAAKKTYSSHKSNYAYIAPRKSKDKNWAIGLSASNGALASSNSVDGYLPTRGVRSAQLNSYEAGIRATEIDQVMFNNISEGNAKSDIKHHMPVTFGASVRFDLDDKWAIETGLTYTMLSSEWRSGTKENYYGEEQKLHYVGIPLKVNREIWSNKCFEVYASAGGAVEKSVSGKLHTTYVVSGDKSQTSGTEDVKVKPLQWSLSAAAGAQFKITDKLGIYAEPGVVYYFDDGSNVTSIRKEHPFNFNIQLGVRLTLPK